ncbi:MAG TPA: trehalose-6-phosphate synthase [Dongiaceae bacterium]|nr:trehalose-6-phosphate synthase [Dongiaceae bacterium]
MRPASAIKAQEVQRGEGGERSRLIVVSHRVASTGARAGRAGGLEVALREALDQREGVWFGWSGECSADPGRAPHIRRAGRITYATIDLPETDHREFYAEFSNGVLWPLFHYRMGLSEFRRKAFEGYLRVNERFARQLAALVRPEDRIWVHDYHFIPLAAALRRLGVANPIGFFLHTPFPAPEVLVALPVHRRLICDLTAYDVIGFQTGDCAQAFRRYIAEEAQGRLVGEHGIEAFGRRATVGAFPISIDTAGFAELAEISVHGREVRRLKDSLANRALIIGVDRLDYSKGLPQRLQAFGELLNRWPEHRSKVTFMQVAPISRGELAQYRALRREIEGLAGRLNGKYSEFDWVPVRYLNKSLPREVLAGFYRSAQVGLITPMRDGMNLVAKEYVAAQDPVNPGVLVLSRFAGAARELTEALIVNPFDTDQVAAALHAALAMPLEERQARWRSMMDVLTRNTIAVWRERFLAALEATARTGASGPPRRAVVEYA